GIVRRIDEDGFASVVDDVSLHRIAADFALNGFDARHHRQRLRKPFFQHNVFQRRQAQPERTGNRPKLRAIVQLITAFKGRDIRAGQPGQSSYVADGKFEPRAGFLDHVAKIIFQWHVVSSQAPEELFPSRVAPTWAPSRPQRGPYTGRGARTAGLVGDRTRIVNPREPT